MTTIDLDQVLPNGLTMRQQLEKQREAQNNPEPDLTPKPVATGSTIGLLNGSAILMFVCAAILIFMGIAQGPRFGIGLIGIGVGTAISGVIIKGLSNIVSLLTDIRDNLK